MENLGTLTVYETAITNNINELQNVGGGILNGGTLSLDSSTVDNNFADGGGGGIWSNGVLAIRNSTISSNDAGFGGGILLLGGTATIINSTIAGNTAELSGGIAAGLSPQLTLHNTIVADNTAIGSGGYNQIDDRLDPSSSHNLIGVQVSYLALEVDDGINGNQIGVEFPQLGPLADNGGPTMTHALLGGSPAIDAGGNQESTDAGLTFDQRGESRFVDAGIGAAQVDIGAYEFRDVIAPTAVLDAPDAIPQGQDLILDGTASVDNHSAPLTYRWSRVGGLINGQTSITTSTPQLAVSSDDMAIGTVRFSLVVTDAVGNMSAAAIVNTEIVESLAPTSILVAPSSVSHGDGILLDGSLSFDPPPGQIVAYRWSRVGGLILGQSSITTSTSTLLIPTDSYEFGTETFSLQVIDGEGNVSGSASTQVRVVDAQDPVAVLVTPPSVGLGEDLLLNGSGSIDPAPGQITEYRWSRAGGLINGQPSITTTSPTLVVSTDSFVFGVETFSLQVVDAAGNVSVPSIADVIIVDESRERLYCRDRNQFVIGEDFLLDGGASLDPPPGQIVEYRWRRVGGFINGQSVVATSVPTLTVSSIGYQWATEVFELVAVDDAGDQSTPARVDVQFVLPPIDLHFASPAVVEVVSGGTVTVGEQLRLRLSPENLRPVAATNAQLVVNLPAGVVLDGVAVEGISSPIVQLAGNVVTIDLELEQVPERDVELLVTLVQSGLWKVDAALSADEPDLDPQNNQLSFLIIPETLVVDTISDTDNGDYGSGDLSLREAIYLANDDAFGNTITFSLPTNSAIALDSGELPTIVEHLIVSAPGAKDLAVGDNPTATIFRIGSEAEVEISGLTIRGGHRGIENLGTVTVYETAITSNINELQNVGGVEF